MSSVVNPTYFLSPNWTFRPNGPIALGNIIIDPFRPHKPLTKPSTTKDSPADTAIPQLPPVETVTEKKWALSVASARSVSVSVWAHFLDILTIKLGAHGEHIKNGHFTMKSLDTEYFTEDPSAEYIALRCSESVIKQLMKPGSVLTKPVYMVTGVKVAKGFALKADESTKAGMEMKGGGPVHPGVSVGGSAEASGKNSVSEGFESAQDIIFAYQLMKIAPKGWGKNATLKTAEFHHKAALLDDDDGTDQNDKVELDYGPLVAEAMEGRPHETQVVEATEEGQGPVSVTVMFESQH